MLSHESMHSTCLQMQNNLGEGQALLHRDEYFHLWIENIADIITIFKADGTISYQSASITRILGWEVEERIGQNLFVNPITHPDDIQAQQTFLFDAINHPNEVVTSTFRLLRKDGTPCYIEAIGRNLLHHPFVQGIVATYRDITERMELERRKEEFIRVASHELRIPITNFKGHTQVLKMMLASYDEMQEPVAYLSIMDQQIDRLNRLVTGLLDATKIRARIMDYKDTLFEVDPFVRNLVILLQQSNPSYSLRMSGESHARLFADKDRLAQVIINLITNAITYSPKGRPVDVKVAAQDDQVLIQVCDYGKGIPERYLQQIFERFYRVPDTDNENCSGLGIGLYVAREIIARHHGELQVESQPGKGSTFSISLPINTR